MKLPSITLPSISLPRMALPTLGGPIRSVHTGNGGSGGGEPDENVLLWENGSPVLLENGDYLLIE